MQAPTELHVTQSFEGKEIPTHPRVSIVMPVYNGRRFIEDALESVAALREKIDLELVVADGGSTDGTFQRLGELPFARGFSAPDAGVYDAVNRALTLARGRYVQWLNADDMLGSSFLAHAVSLLDECDPQVDFVLGETVFVDYSGAEIDRWHYDAQAATDFQRHAQGRFYNINSALFRIESLRRNGPFDQEEFPLAADRDLEFRLCINGCDARVVDHTAYVFRRHSHSLTGSRAAWATNHLADAAVYARWARRDDLPDAWRIQLISSRIDARLTAAYLSLKYPDARCDEAFKVALEEVLRNPVLSSRLVAAKLVEYLRNDRV